MLVGRLSGLGYRAYLARAALPSLAALVVTAAIVYVMHRRELSTVVEHTHEQDAHGAQKAPPRALLVVSVGALIGVVVANLAGASIAWSALVGASIVIVAAQRRAEALLHKVDWSVLLFFAGLFVVVAGFRKTGLAAQWLAPLAPMAKGARGTALLVAVLLVGSQIVSNVPLILLLEPWIHGFSDRSTAWTITAIVSTLAGNFTLLGSVANVIVIEQSKETIGFWDYLKIGVPVTIASTAVAMALL
jgi:Na+/H+ antiporter NhaD/arsenite permease-like protein